MDETIHLRASQRERLHAASLLIGAAARREHDSERPRVQELRDAERLLASVRHDLGGLHAPALLVKVTHTAAESAWKAARQAPLDASQLDQAAAMLCRMLAGR
jgi:hypothetical protein